MAALRYVLLALAFGAFVTAHVALVLTLAARAPRRRALFALILPPLAPFWGFRARRAGMSAFWLLSASIYALLLVLSLR